MEERAEDKREKVRWLILLSGVALAFYLCWLMLQPFVRVLPPGSWPRTAATLGTNACHLQATVDADSGRIVVVSAIDNLGKGAAGQALQCANLMAGLPETTGLPTLAVHP